MRIPHPAALLVEHPTLPDPEIAGAVREEMGEPAAAVRPASLPKRERYRAAARLTAAAALLAEFDLWLPRSAFSGDRLFRSSDGIRPVLARYPLPLSQLVDRLGGGEAATEAAWSTVLGRIAEAVGLSASELEVERPGPGLSSFDALIARQLRELPRPLDHETARALWALRWNPLPPPEEGLIALWRVPVPAAARRLAAALWCEVRRRGMRAWVWPAEDGASGPPPIPAVRGAGTVIIVGRLSNAELNSMARWAARSGCSAVGIGLFPRGWRAEPPPRGCGSLTGRLAVAGLPPDVARKFLEGRQDRFAPFEDSDRVALTESLRGALAPRRSGRRTADRGHPGGALTSWLGLSPDGLPPGFIALQGGLVPARLEVERRRSAVVEVGPRWRLPEPVPLERDPRHLKVAGLYPPDDPLHLLHTALGSGDTAALEVWARSRLDRLDAVPVRELLSMVAGGALGESVQLLLAEACLAVLDLFGARSALSPLPERRRVAVELWCEALDPKPAVPRRLPGPRDAVENPRAAAETAALVLDDVGRSERSAASEAAAMIDSCRRRLAELLSHRLDIELAYRLTPERLEDPAWRRLATAGHPGLRAQLAHRRALWHLDCGRPRTARRLLELVSRDLVGPGLRGMVELDLGAVALSEGRSREAEGHHLRAFHLLRAAGFRHRTSLPLFNLAVADVDQLRLPRAAERLGDLAADDPREPFVLGECARLALASGDEPLFCRRLEDFEHEIDAEDPRFAEGLALLRGARALLDGEPRRAMHLLQRAGQEGEAWRALAASVAGEPVEPAEPDAWGVSLAAELVGGPGPGDSKAATLALRADRLGDGFALALGERVRGERFPVPAKLRSRLAALLRRSGLEGWAESLSGLGERAGGIVAVLARVVEAGGLEALDPQDVERLEASLGVTGLEIRDALDGTPVWRHGHGAPGGEVRRGRLVAVPLGGILDEGPSGRLLLGVLDLVLPRRPETADCGADETGFFGVSDAARALRRELRELGPTHLPVLLVGETGVGKEVAARALHTLSRRKGAFVAVNVAAIPAALLEAELFGSVKGAYTGADRSRRGLAIAADAGTLFLDEIGDLEPGLQVKLLRFIESREVRAVGTHLSREVDVRIVSATHRDLDRQIREGDFRRDLYFRIAAPAVSIPPLRARTDDIPLFREVFEREAHARHGLPRPAWSPESESLLRRYHWPGNVRELRQVVEVAMVRAQGETVRPEHLPIAATSSEIGGSWDAAQREFRRRFLSAALKRNGGNRSATARELGISRQALLYHIRNLGLKGAG